MMNEASTPTKQPAAVNPPGKLAHATPTTAPLVAGRRSFFKYRDLGVTAASSGKLRAQVTIGADGMTQPTGWHYHVCEGQFVYPGRLAAQRDGGVERPRAPGDLRSRGHGHRRLRSARGLFQKRVTPR